jgi:hypothetical protein
MAELRGRPKTDRETVRVTMYFDEEVIRRADRLAAKARISRSRLVSNLVDEGLKGLERADMVGILDFALLMRDFSEGVKSWANQVRDEGHDIKRDWEEGRMAEA